MSNTYEEKLGKEKMLPLMMKMAMPAVGAQLVNLFYNMVDRIYIGHIEGIGKQALAGIGITSSSIILISAFSSIVSGGGAPLAAIELGKGDREKAGQYLGNGFAMLLLFALFCMGLGYSFMEPILRFSGASPETMVYAKDYLSIYLLGTIFVQISLGLNNFINIQGRAGIAMCSVAIGAILNIVLDPLFIFVFHMDVKGAALATIISQAISGLWIVLFLRSDQATLRLKRKCMAPNKKIILSMVALGISPFVMASTESLVGFTYNRTLRDFGDIYVSALTVMQSAMQICSVPLAGFAQGFVPIISYNYGSGNQSRVKLCYKIALIIMFTFNFCVIMLMILFPHQVAIMFNGDKELVKVVESMMPIFLMGMTIFGLQRTCQQTLVALGQAKVSVFIALLRKVILLMPLILILSERYGVKGAFLAESIADATAAICCTIIFFFQFRKILGKENATKGYC